MSREGYRVASMRDDIEASRWTQHLSNQPYRPGIHAPPRNEGLNDMITFESFILGPDEKKVEEKLDTRMPNTSIFKFNREDHTMGNLLRSKLLTNSHVTFSAYRVPHPLFPTFELRVSTDGQITPKQAVLGACRDLVKELGQLKTNFSKEYDLRKMVASAQNGQ